MGLTANSITLAVVFVVFAGFWRTFEKAGQPGWGCLIPIYNLYVMLEMAERPGWWLFLMLIPLVNIVIGIIVSIEIAERFGRGALFGFGLALLAPIFYPILGFGEAEYHARG